MKPVEEVPIVIGIVERGDKILLLQRMDKNPIWDKKWEFPGGKIDDGEEAQVAAKREIEEETGLSISNLNFVGKHVHDWDLEEKTLRVHIHCFHCKAHDGEVVIETDKAYQYKWDTVENATKYDTLEANAFLLKTLFAAYHEKCQNLG